MTCSKAGDVICQPGVAEALEQLGAEGAEPFYRGEIAQRVVRWLTERGGILGGEDLAAYRVIDQKQPVRVAYRGRQVLTNPPPSAGGILLAQALSRFGGGSELAGGCDRGDGGQSGGAHA